MNFSESIALVGFHLSWLMFSASTFVSSFPLIMTHFSKGSSIEAVRLFKHDWIAIVFAYPFLHTVGSCGDLNRFKKINGSSLTAFNAFSVLLKTDNCHMLSGNCQAGPYLEYKYGPA